LIPSYARRRPASQAFLSHKYYEPLTHELIAKLLKRRPGDLIHAGTFFGDMLPSFSKKCSGTIYAFEPVLENYILSKLCIELNEISNVLLWNVGLGKEVSSAQIDTGDKERGHAGGASQIAETGQSTSLVHIDIFELRSVSIIHLDIEGFELNALKGAVKTITTCTPVILLEDNSRNCTYFLECLGYQSVGRIPGLSVWAEKKDAPNVRKIVDDL